MLHRLDSNSISRILLFLDTETVFLSLVLVSRETHRKITVECVGKIPLYIKRKFCPPSIIEKYHFNVICMKSVEQQKMLEMLNCGAPHVEVLHMSSFTYSITAETAALFQKIAFPKLKDCAVVMGSVQSAKNDNRLVFEHLVQQVNGRVTLHVPLSAIGPLLEIQTLTHLDVQWTKPFEVTHVRAIVQNNLHSLKSLILINIADPFDAFIRELEPIADQLELLDVSFNSHKLQDWRYRISKPFKALKSLKLIGDIGPVVWFTGFHFENVLYLAIDIQSYRSNFRLPHTQSNKFPRVVKYEEKTIGLSPFPSLLGKQIRTLKLRTESNSVAYFHPSFLRLKQLESVEAYSHLVSDIQDLLIVNTKITSLLVKSVDSSLARIGPRLTNLRYLKLTASVNYNLGDMITHLPQLHTVKIVTDVTKSVPAMPKADNIIPKASWKEYHSTGIDNIYDYFENLPDLKIASFCVRYTVQMRHLSERLHVSSLEFVELDIHLLHDAELKCALFPSRLTISRIHFSETTSLNEYILCCICMMPCRFTDIKHNDALGGLFDDYSKLQAEINNRAKPCEKTNTELTKFATQAVLASYEQIIDYEIVGLGAEEKNKLKQQVYQQLTGATKRCSSLELLIQLLTAALQRVNIT